MIKDGFGKLYWGFLFIMVSFRLGGFDILPAIIGFVLFYVGLGVLVLESEYFLIARRFTVPMIFISILSVYEVPAQESGVNFGLLGWLGIPIMLLSIGLTLYIVFNIFLGIKEMAQQQGKLELIPEADTKWSHFLMLQLAIIFAFILIIIPPLAVLYIIVLFIVSIVITVSIMQFVKKCETELGN